MIKNLQELIAIPSITGAPAQEGMPYGKYVYDALMYVLELCDSFGFRTKNCNNLAGYAEIGQGQEMIGVLCHLDVVPEGAGWKYPPFGGEIHDGKLFGRGVIDDKGPAILVIHAMKEIVESGIVLNKRIRIIFGCQEESGDWEDMEYYKQNEEHPAYGFTPDADFPVIYGEKGILMLKLNMPIQESGVVYAEGGNAPNMVADYAEAIVGGKKFKAIGVSAHGSLPWEGENAISKMMDEIQKFTKGTEMVCRFADFYMNKIGYQLHGESMQARFEDKESGKISMNVGTLKTTQTHVELGLDVRYPVTFQKETILNAIVKSVEEYNVSVSVDSFSKPIYMDEHGEVIQTLMEAYSEVTLDDTKPMVIGGGTYARLLDNIVAFGPMFPGKECTEHQPNEYLELEDLWLAKSIYKKALEKLLLL